MGAITVDQLEAAVMAECEDYISAACGASDEAVIDAGDEMVSELVATSPATAGDGGKLGHYRDGWEAVRSGEPGNITVYIHNAKKPGLTHLLEHGHGGPHPAPAHPHIEPAYRKVSAKFEKEAQGDAN